jgi:fermentation-respiration switch protein FrsA (DUF1100 family)
VPKLGEITKANASKYIFMAGNARPLQNILLEQFKYLNTLDPSNLSDKSVQNLEKEIQFLNSKEFNLKTPKEDLPMGLSAVYWNYLIKYNPLKEVRLIKNPIFFGQGGKDYQVTEKDFELWQAYAKNNKAAEFKFYPDLNHIFMKGSSIATPNDYKIKGNVDDSFLEDIVNFIIK